MDVYRLDNLIAVKRYKTIHTKITKDIENNANKARNNRKTYHWDAFT